MSDFELADDEKQITPKDPRLEGLTPQHFVERTEHDYSAAAQRLKGDLEFALENAGLPTSITRLDGEFLYPSHPAVKEGVARVALLVERVNEDELEVGSEAIEETKRFLQPFALYQQARRNLERPGRRIFIEKNKILAEMKRMIETGNVEVDDKIAGKFAEGCFLALERYYLNPEPEPPEYLYDAPPLPPKDSPEYQYYQIATELLGEKTARQFWDLVRDYAEGYLLQAHPLQGRSDPDARLYQSTILTQILFRVTGPDFPSERHWVYAMELRGELLKRGDILEWQGLEEAAASVVTAVEEREDEEERMARGAALMGVPLPRESEREEERYREIKSKVLNIVETAEECFRRMHKNR